jgi:hypothetical protein
MFSRDKQPRKKRVETPKSKPGLASMIVWSENAWHSVSNIVTNAYLKSNSKKNLRQLTKAQVKDLEQLKLDVFTNLEIDDSVNEKTVYSKIKSGVRTPSDFTDNLNSNNINIDSMTIDNYRAYILGLFVERQIG